MRQILEYVSAGVLVISAVLLAGAEAAPIVDARPGGAAELHGSVQIKGSDTMVNLCQAWAEAFMKAHPDVSIAVTGGGSGTGIAALIGGTCDLAAASRTMKAKEIALATGKGGAPKEWIVARDGLAVAVHPRNPIQRLTISQVAGLFTGSVSNWRQLGGPDMKVVLLSREVNSGTHVYFKEHVLASAAEGQPREFSPEALLLPSSQAIADEVASNAAAIGYYGMGYRNEQNAVVAIAKTAADPYVAPSEDTVRSGAYPITRPLMLYVSATASPAAHAFLQFVLSPEGQAIVRQEEFVPVGSAQP